MNCSTRNTTTSNPFSLAQQVLERTHNHSGSDQGALSIVEGDTGLTFEFDVPGLGHDDITINLEDGRLTVAGSRQVASDGGNEVYSERRSLNFRRVLRLDRRLDPSSVDAELSDGVLRVTVARRPEAEKRTITVRSATTE